MILAVAIGSIIVSKKLFEGLIHRVLHNPMSFFDITPIGRILNRLGKEVDTVDNRLAMILRFWLSGLLGV